MFSVSRTCLQLTLCFVLAASASADEPHVVYMSPSSVGDVFDSNVVDLMETAAEDLGIKLTVVNVLKYQVYNQQRLDNIYALKPDYLVLSYQIYTDKVIQQAAEHGIKCLIINSPISDAEREKVGYPRQKFKNWIGHIYPDDYQAGHQLTQLIYQQAVGDHPELAGKAQLIAFNGHRATMSAFERRRGLEDASRDLGVDIKHIYAADWDPDVTTRALPQAAKKYPSAKLYWAGSDAIALRIIEHQKVRGLAPQKDYYTAGIDWALPALDSIAKGELSASIGGHFLVGAWAMVMIADYHSGHDFADWGVETQIPLAIAEQSNIKLIQHIVEKKVWRDVDFKLYSRAHNPNLSGYDFRTHSIFGILPIE